MTLQNKIKTVTKRHGNQNTKKIHFLETSTETEFWNELATGRYKYCIVDSISQVANTAHKIVDFMQKSVQFPGVSFINIIHSRRARDGKRESDYKGSSAIGHLVDINQRVVDGVVWNDKNRFLGRDCLTSSG